MLSAQEDQTLRHRLAARPDRQVMSRGLPPHDSLLGQLRQGPPRCQGIQETRRGGHPVPPGNRSPDHGRGTHPRTDPDLLADQPRRHPTTDSGVDHAIVPTSHQAKPAPTPQPPSPSAHAYVRQRTPLRAHLDMRQQDDSHHRESDYCECLDWETDGGDERSCPPIISATRGLAARPGSWRTLAAPRVRRRRQQR